jgi:hypothetical protein
VWLAPAALYAAERAVRERLGATVGWGVAIAIGVPLLAILALVTLVGIPFGVALLLAAIPVLLVAYTTTAWIIGRRVLRNRSASPWAALLTGNNEVPLDTIRRLLDHNSPEMTARYAQIKDETPRRVGAVLPPLLAAQRRHPNGRRAR